MSEFISEQISVSTAEDEHNYFTGQPDFLVRPNPNAIRPPGTYRVIEGSLYRVISGVPPKLLPVGSERNNLEDISSARR